MSTETTAKKSEQVIAFAIDELAAHFEMLKLNLDEYRTVLAVDTALAPDGKDSYTFKFDDDGAEIIGSNARSVLLGVYAYLRRIGFVFLYPGKGGTKVPVITAKQQLFCPKTSHTASFYHRGVCIEGADSLEHAKDFIDWLPKNGFNTFFLQFKKPDVFFNQWYDHINNPLLPAEPRTREQLDDIERILTHEIEKRGILDHRVGHGWTGEAIGLNTTGWYEEKQPLPDDIKPLIAQVNGKRELWYGVPTNTNLCYSNPAARKKIIDRIVTYAKENPNVDYVHFWLADANNNHCECDECRKSTPTDLYVEMLNELDEALTAEGLETKIVFLLYQELLYAPVKERLKNTDRFCLMFAPISRTFEKSYPKDFAGEDVEPFVLNKFRMPKTVEGNLAHYLNWKSVYNGDGFFYDYPLGRAHYGDLGYMKISKTIYDDVHSLRALGTRGYMSCQELRAMCPTGFPNYVMGQSLLDDTVPYDTMKRDYFSAMFGAGWEQVVNYLERVSELSSTDYTNGHGERVQPELSARFEQIVDISQAFLAEADAIHPNDFDTHENWEFLKFHGKYCVLLAKSLALLSAGKKTDAETEFDKFLQYIRENEMKYSTRLDVFRVTQIMTNYTGFALRSQR